MRIYFLRYWLIGFVFTLLFQFPAKTQSIPATDKQKLDSYLNKLFEKNKMMGSVAIDSAGNEVYNQSLGFIDEDLKTAADRNTMYRIGSVTKTFTATMIFQLIEKDKFTLSTKLSEFYPKVPQADSITIEHLLRHQSGLYNFTNAENYPDWMTEEQSKSQLLEIFYADDPEFNPGEQTSYSNTNYVLLQFIIEDVTGNSYANQLQKQIAEPLALSYTHYGDTIEPEKNEALSFQYQDDRWQKAPETDMSVPGGAGAIVSTPDELTDFIHALFEGDLISQASLEQMMDIDQQFGMGLIQMPFYDRYIYGHTGGIDGFQSHLVYFPDDEVAVALTSNGLNYSMNDILVGVLRIYFGKDFEIPSLDQKTISLSADQMEQFIGNFSSNQIPMDINLFIEDSTMKAQATGQAAFPVKASDSSTLRFDQAGISMEFDSLSNGKYQQFILRQSGGKFKFQRQNEE